MKHLFNKSGLDVINEFTICVKEGIEWFLKNVEGVTPEFIDNFKSWVEASNKDKYFNKSLGYLLVTVGSKKSGNKIKRHALNINDFTSELSNKDSQFHEKMQLNIL